MTATVGYTIIMRCQMPQIICALALLLPAIALSKGKQDIAVMEASMGTIEITFYPDKAPLNTKNFKDLARKGFYDGTAFHRIVPGFVIQGGDPLTKLKKGEKWDPTRYGTGGPGYTVPLEKNDIKHDLGILSMARSSDPNSAGSQFFIMLGRATHLDGAYSAFGKVIKGIEVVQKIEKMPTSGQLALEPVFIKKLSIVER
jgi:cyclophilin family peptidyl-prolyl cis-trans isomerase